jgi:hypothetical protein
MDAFLIPTQFNVKDSEHVYLLQQVLVFVLRDELEGKKTIASTEISSRTYGRTTREAVAFFQEKYGLVQTPELSEETVNMLNSLAQKRYRVYGIVTDDANLPVEGITQRLYYKLFKDDLKYLIGEGASLEDGSYRIYLDFTDKEDLLQNGKLKNQLCGVIEFYQNNALLFTSDEFFVSEHETLRDYSSPKFVYTGDSLYITTKNILIRNGIQVESLIQKTPNELQKISVVTDIDTEMLMRLIFSVSVHNTNADMNILISISDVFGYLYQNFPPNMPVTLFNGTLEGDDWDYYKSDLEKCIISGMELLSKEEHISILTDAVKLRYIPRITKEEIESLADSILEHRYKLLETLPVLEGKSSISSISNAIKDIIVDNPGIWTTHSQYTENLISVSKRKEKVLSFKSRMSVMTDSFIERDMEITGGERCEVTNIDDFTIQFKGNVAYSKSLNSHYRINVYPPFGHYIGVRIRIPENIDPYEFFGKISNSDIEPLSFYYNDLSAQEIEEGYIHIYINLSKHFTFDNQGYLPDNKYSISFHWGNSDEIFLIETKDMFLEPCMNETEAEIHVERDFLCTGGEKCEFVFDDHNHISFYGMTGYSQGIHSYGLHPSGYYAGVAVFVNRETLKDCEWRIQENGQARIISPDMLTQEERSGGFVHIYFDLESPKYGLLKDVHFYSPYVDCYIHINNHEFLPYLQMEQDLELTGGAGCEMHYNNETNAIFSGDVIYSKYTVAQREGNYAGLYLYPPYVSGGYDMRDVDCFLQKSAIHIHYEDLSEKEKNNNYIHVLLDFNNITAEDIHINWGIDFRIDSNVNLLHQGETPHIPTGEGYIYQDTSVGGDKCQSTVKDNNTISFHGQIDWLESKGGNFIAVNIFAPAGNYDLSHLQFLVRGEWLSYDNLSTEEKDERRIHIFLSYDTVPSDDAVFVEWKNGLAEQFYIEIEQGTDLQKNPNPPVQQYDFGEWKLKLTEIFTNHITGYDEFVKELKEKEDYLYPADADKVISCFDVSRVAMNYTPAMENILAVPIIEEYGVRSMATLSENDCLQLLQADDYPSVTPGKNPAEKRNNYAKIIYGNAQKLYPDIYMISEIERRQEEGIITDFNKAGEIKELLLEHKEFDLLVNKVDDLPITDNTVREQLISLQNVYKLTPTPQATVEFITVGFRNAKEIYGVGKEQVVTQLAGRLSQVDAESAYNAATATRATLLAAFTNINAQATSCDFSVLRLSTSKIKEKINADTGIAIAALDELFGDTDTYCECEHDSSLYSAAAYLGSLLYYLEQRSANNSEDPNAKVFQFLNERRADIGKIILNKQNTDTIMPYIDLVCEVLEENILYQESKGTGSPYNRPVEQCQSTLSSKELLAAPEHILSLSEGKTAYDILRNCIYPMFAPLDLWQSEIRIFLDLMGINRYALMKAFQNGNSPSNPDIAAEFFKLTTHEQKVVTQTETIDYRNKAWCQNFSESGIEPMPVVDFMRDSGLSIYETIDICNENGESFLARWVNITLEELLDCKIKGKNVTGTAKTFDKAHRFIRLWRNSGWKIWELDLLLKSQTVTNYTPNYDDNDNLDGDALTGLMTFKQQQDLLELAAENLLALYENINRLKLRENGKEIPCLYDRLFLQKALSNPLNEHLKSIKDNDSTVIDNTDEKLVMACLSLSEEDYVFLKDIWGNTALNIDYLSYLYRNSLLAKKLKIKVNDLFTIYRLMEDDGTVINIKKPYSLSIINDIIAFVQEIKKYKFSIAEYEYLAKYVYNGEDYISEEAKSQALTEAELDNYLLQLDTVFVDSVLAPTYYQIEKVNSIFRAIDSYKEYFIRYLLGTDLYNNPDDIAFLIQCIECTSDKTDEEIDAFAKRFFPENPAFYLELDLHNIDITNEDILITRYNNVCVYIDTTAQSTLVYNYISEFFTIPTETTKLLLTSPTEKFEGSWIRSFFYRESRKNTNANIKVTLYNYLIFVHKAALLIRENTISFDEMNLLLDTQSKLEFYWFNIKIDTDQQSWDTAKDFLKLNAMLSLHRNLGATKKGQTLLSIINTDYTNNKHVFYTTLCELTAWNTAQFFSLKNILMLRINDFYQSQTYDHVAECLSMADSIAVNIDTIDTWKLRSEHGERERSEEIKDTAGSHYDADTWLDKLPEIQKPIREIKSNALASFLMAYSWRGLAGKDILWTEKNDLYAYFLLDVEMSACMKISRIVQATSSVQLFVQRCFLNLEKNVYVDADKDTRWLQWEWMKKYRLWEANLKVFLYPENWIEPELRDNKTIFFKELEDELSQGEITAENVEKAFENYLQKLNDVANLVVCGVYNEKISDDDGVTLPDGRRLKTGKKATVHVIGHTKSTPFQYYYRTYDAFAGEWKEWEKIDLDIQSDMVIPIVYNRRLHIFWLSVIPKSINNSNPGEANPPTDYDEIQLVWSVLKNGKWTGINYSERRNIFFGSPHPLFNYSIVLRNRKDTNNLYIDVFFKNDYKRNENEEFYDIMVPLGYFKFDGDVNFAETYGDIDSFKQILPNMDINRCPSEITEKEKISSVPNLSYGKMYSNRVYMNKGDDVGIKLLGDSNQNSAFDIMTSGIQDSNLVSGLYSEGKGKGAAMSTLLDSYTKNFFFYQDAQRSFFIEPYAMDLVYIVGQTETKPKHLTKTFAATIEPGTLTRYLFRSFYHPYTKLFIKELNRAGIEGLLNRDIQINPQLYDPKNEYNFASVYNPDSYYVDYKNNMTDKYGDIIDFDYSGAYSMYNWELFFHVPLYLACKLSQDQKFEEAMQWFHYIFNPTVKEAGESPQKFWITKSFYEMTTVQNRAQQVENILKNIQQQAQSVNAWLNNPYNPHAVARTRPVAYQRTVVMKYIDNLIAWADQLFRQDSIESNNEATLLYILAYEILGKRPVMLPEKQLSVNTHLASGNSDTFSAFESVFKAIETISLTNNSNLETIASPNIARSGGTLGSYETFSMDKETGNHRADMMESVIVHCQYRSAVIPLETNTNSKILPDFNFDTSRFCLPLNEDMFKYWDIVEDRLFKLRNCMNIEGVVRELPLFEPPIDPAMLVKAAAAGLSISEALNDITASQPYYRFRTVIQKAIEYASEVKQLGDKLLSALEKKDAETLNILRSTQEINLQQASVQVRKLQIDEAKENMENINTLIAATTARKEYYESREYMNSLESTSYGLSVAAGVIDVVVNTGKLIAGGLHSIPDLYTGGAGVAATPVAVAEITGGNKIGSAIVTTMDALSIVGHALDRSSSLSLTMAGYQRRKEDWDFQAKMATMELTQLQTQLTAAEIRLMIAEKELGNMQMQIEQSKSVLEYYKDKYTNEALYNWMVTQVSSVYFQSYKLAYDMAKKAEKCYQHELGIYDTTNFVQFGYWDSLKKGLLSGEKLIHDLHKLEASYLDKNKRTLELTKHISLAQMFPLDLIKLITERSITLDLPEFIFDMDYPGHYMRRIKSVSVTIPNVAGPFTNVSFMLTLQSAKVRKNTTGNTYEESGNLNDPRFVYQTGGRESICTSSAQNDSGMFEINFGDERYLPFENAGVISTWGLSLPAGCDQFDISTISDVILHINYTALYDGNLAIKAKEALKDKLPIAGTMLFSPKQDFPDAWNKMDAADKTMSFELKTENLPFFLRGQNAQVSNISMMLSVKDNFPQGNLTFSLKGTEIVLEPVEEAQGNILLFEGNVTDVEFQVLGEEWELILDNSLDLSKVEEIIIGFTLETEPPVKVTKTTPQSGDNVEPDTSISVEYSENVTAKDLSLIKLFDGMDYIPVNSQISGKILTITPTTSLQNSKRYTVTIPNKTIEEYVGSYSFTFVTLPVVTLIETFPIENAEEVDVETSVIFTFSRDIKLSSAGSITVKTGTTNIPFSLNAENNKLTITPSSQLPGGKEIIVTISNGAIKSFAGTQLVFTTIITSSLIHHFPLSNNGELSDIVGSATVSPQGNRFTWSSTNNMYRAINSKDQKSAIIQGLNLGMEVGQKVNNVSLIATIKAIAYNYSQITILTNNGYGNNLVTGISYDASLPLHIPVGQTKKIALTFDGIYKRTYLDAVLVETVAVSTNLVTTDSNSFFNIGYSVWSQGNGEFCIKDLMFFNKVLTDEEIQNL